MADNIISLFVVVFRDYSIIPLNWVFQLKQNINILLIHVKVFSA